MLNRRSTGAAFDRARLEPLADQEKLSAFLIPYRVDFTHTPSHRNFLHFVRAEVSNGTGSK